MSTQETITAIFSLGPRRYWARRKDMKQNMRWLRVTVRFEEGGDPVAPPWSCYAAELPKPFKLRVKASLAAHYLNHPMISDHWPWDDGKPPALTRTWDRLAVKTAARILDARGNRYVIKERDDV